MSYNTDNTAVNVSLSWIIKFIYSPPQKKNKKLNLLLEAATAAWYIAASATGEQNRHMFITQS